MSATDQVLVNRHGNGDVDCIDIEQLVREHLPLVGFLVTEAASKVPSHVNRDDLTSAGMLALTQAAQSFDPERGVPFGRYATLRIRGALIDELRSRDWATRSVRTKARQRAAATESLSAILGRLPTSHEVAEHLGMSVDELAAIEEDVHRSVVLSIHGVAEAGDLDSLLPHDEPGPEQVLLSRERDAYLLDAVAALPERLRTVVAGYYFSERPMADIAEELGVTESRVSQMHSEALSLLRGGMTAMLSPEQGPAVPPQGCVARRKAAYYASIAAQSDFRTRLTATPGTSTRFSGVA
jgi:RNA polymerase sigma factor for flagellar operon FliA